MQTHTQSPFSHISPFPNIMGTFGPHKVIQTRSPLRHIFQYFYHFGDIWSSERRLHTRVPCAMKGLLGCCRKVWGMRYGQEGESEYEPAPLLCSHERDAGATPPNAAWKPASETQTDSKWGENKQM